MNPITVCCAAVLMLGLAACGSDDDGPTTSGGPMAEEVTLASLQAGLTVAPGTYRITGAEADLTALLTALSEVEVPDVGYAPGSAAVTAGGIMLMCSGDSESNCTVTVHDDDSVTVAGTILVAAADGMFPLTDAQRAEAAVAAQKLATDAAVTKETAMTAEAAQAVDDGPGGMDATTDHSIGIEHDGTGATVTIEVVDAAAGAREFEQAEVMLDGGRSMHVRTMEADDDGNVVEEVMIVATDIEAPMEVAFKDWEDAAGTKPHLISVRRDGETVDADNPADSMSVLAGTDNANLPLIMATLFAPPQAGSSSVTHTFLHGVEDVDPDTEGNQPRAAATVDGTYRGADGTYTCSGDGPCTVTVNDEGEVASIAGTWLFTPDTGATADQQDHDYLRYGFWLKKTTDADGAVTYNEVETFAGSSVAPSGSLALVRGTASYEGGAVGVYVMKRGYSQTTGVLDDATSGHFKARASLTATFAQTIEMDIAPNMVDSITGTIDQFELSGGEAPAWAVKLDGDIAPATGTVVDGITSDVAENGADGTFTGTFHGSVTENNDVIPKPSSVVGEFNANFQNGAVAGAFGARKLPESE